jgi:hypothetical protein
MKPLTYTYQFLCMTCLTLICFMYKVWQANFLFWTERSEGKRKLACRTLYIKNNNNCLKKIQPALLYNVFQLVIALLIRNCMHSQYPNVHHTLCNTLPLNPILSYINPVHSLTLCSYRIHFNNISYQYLAWNFLPCTLNKKIQWLLISFMCVILVYPANPIHLQLMTLTISSNGHKS